MALAYYICSFVPSNRESRFSGMAWFTRQITVQIEGQVTWQVVRDTRDGHWFGVCQPLNINAAGSTWGEFEEAMKESIALLFESLIEHGELEAFLRRNNWRAGAPTPPPGARIRIRKVEIPTAIELKERFAQLAIA